MRTETMIIYIGIAIVLMGMSAVPSAAEPVNVCILVSPDTIMLDSNSPIFGIETEVYENITIAEIAGLVDGTPTQDDIDDLFPDAYEVSDIYDSNSGSQDITLGVIVSSEYGIVDSFGHPVEGEVVIDVDTRKPYELSPHTGRFVMLYERSEVFNKEIGFDSDGDAVTVGDYLEYACGDGTTGRVPFFISGTFNDGVDDRDFYGYNYADVMHKSQSKGGGKDGNKGGNGGGRTENPGNGKGKSNK
ncbi:hypothetical protein [Methanosarcina sp. 2.H.A.1B.4]|uniref:hypothetical protein n=1 Tax=Methanosarcina sp. 2.H.A.1B.4 TaxID=1483600 RepID=UPI000621670E|nr:hypothetical protein [Methanosarcina sp. 2.H.A.1B.4]KKG11107.1 hypothetical protein EO92_16925 [Methanosarcina sp. 2.H.A.1B.4]